MDYVSQVKQVDKHLRKGGSITTFQAFRWYKITRLARIIHTLNERGMPIERDRVSLGMGKQRKTYTQYSYDLNRLKDEKAE